MFSLTEVVEDWDDIYCKSCSPEATACTAWYRHQQRTHRRRAPSPISRPRWWEAAHGAEVPLMFLIKGRRWRAAPEGADVPPLATPAWDAERALAALNVTEVPFDATNGNMLGYARGRTIAVSPTNPLPHHTRFHELAHVLLGHTTEGRPARRRADAAESS